MSIDVITKGCRLNLYESALMRSMAQTAIKKECVLINSCAVTREAERDTRQTIRRQRRLHPDALIVVTGCAAHRSMDAYGSLPEVDVVMDNHAKRQLHNYHFLSGIEKKKNPNDHATVLRGDADEWGGFVEDVGIDFAGHARAYLAVQRGCDHDCTFCAIPSGRGTSRSLSVERCIREAKILVERGYHELIITGVDITAWGKDLEGEPPLGVLIENLLTHVPMRRLRLSSLDPAEMDETLLRCMTESEILLPAVHLSVQSGDDMILKRMKRRHSSDEVRGLCENLLGLRPDMVFGADIIVGFPTETEEMFERTMALVEECPLSFLHVFPYAVREGTPASRIKPCEPSVIKDRAARLRSLGQHLKRDFIKTMMGKKVSLLMEKEGYGRAECGVMVRLNEPHATGEIVTARVVKVVEDMVYGELMS